MHSIRLYTTYTLGYLDTICNVLPYALFANQIPMYLPQYSSLSTINNDMVPHLDGVSYTLLLLPLTALSCGGFLPLVTKSGCVHYPKNKRHA